MANKQNLGHNARRHLHLAKEEGRRELNWPVLKVTQPIGEFYMSSVRYQDLLDICFFDVRQRRDGGTIEEYIGIQRNLSAARVDEISKFVQLPDASFPTSIIIAIDEQFVNEVSSKDGRVSLTISNKPFLKEYDPITFRGLARVLDGQHRLAGLEKSGIEEFMVNVSLFVGMDISDQSAIFANVNLSQTKVNPSLAYDLQAYNKYYSPHKFCHEIVVALNSVERSPFFKLIKRLGTKTPDVTGETLSQATFVDALVSHITSKQRIYDDIKYYRRSKSKNIFKSMTFSVPSEPDDIDNFVLRTFFINQEQTDLANLIINYFNAIKKHWYVSWQSNETGIVIKKTNGFKAFMRFFPLAYKSLAEDSGDMVSEQEFLDFFENIQLNEETFTTDRAHPGQGGENHIYNALVDASGIDKNIKFKK